jgi:hypothetical protein
MHLVKTYYATVSYKQSEIIGLQAAESAKTKKTEQTAGKEATLSHHNQNNPQQKESALDKCLTWSGGGVEKRGNNSKIT